MKAARLIPLSILLAAAGASAFALALLSRAGSSARLPQPGRSTTVSPGSLTIAFWNVQWFPGRHPDASRREQTRQIRAVQADIAQLDPDIVGLEEVRDAAAAGIAVQPLSGFKVDVCANFPPREGQDVAQEVAITSRLQPLSAWTELWHRNGAMWPPRGFAFAVYEVAPRQLLMVYALHLKSNYGEIQENVLMRQESMRQLSSHIKAMEAAYARLGNSIWIIGGDFNTSLDDNRFAGETTLRGLLERGFAWIWQDVPSASRVTLPPSGGFPAACFDHILYRGATLRRAWVGETSWQSSDHRVIAATFDLPSAAE